MSSRKKWGAPPPWYRDPRRRDAFEATIRSVCPDAEARLTETAYVLRFTVDVPHYESRIVHAFFANKEVWVTADGPTDSPHRWGDRWLCMWHPKDPASRRWIPEFGPELLIDLIRSHLFREAYWRETDIWRGETAPHNESRGAPRSTK